MALYTLVYISVARWVMSDQDLIDILTVSRANNERLGITGMLLYRGDLFIQVLEGEREAVQQVYQSIRHDARHENVHTIYENAIEERAFQNWTMGFNRIIDTDEALQSSIVDFLQSDDPYHYLANDSAFTASLLMGFKEESML